MTLDRVTRAVTRIARRTVCAVAGHQPVRLWPSEKDRCLRILAVRRCRRCGEWVPVGE